MTNLPLIPTFVFPPLHDSGETTNNTSFKKIIAKHLITTKKHIDDAITWDGRWSLCGCSPYRLNASSSRFPTKIKENYESKFK